MSSDAFLSSDADLDTGARRRRPATASTATTVKKFVASRYLTARKQPPRPVLGPSSKQHQQLQQHPRQKPPRPPKFEAASSTSKPSSGSFADVDAAPVCAESESAFKQPELPHETITKKVTNLHAAGPSHLSLQPSMLQLEVPSSRVSAEQLSSNGPKVQNSFLMGADQHTRHKYASNPSKFSPANAKKFIAENLEFLGTPHTTNDQNPELAAMLEDARRQQWRLLKFRARLAFEERKAEAEVTVKAVAFPESATLSSAKYILDGNT
ncbi:hypothetical protein HDU82_006534 [Entophlyctis luteolus]|nr:hypothetical protein HDU82_006534 [Entophlyctis luteolus]